MSTGGNWFQRLIESISFWFESGFLSTHLIFILPITVVFIAGLIFALLRNEGVSPRRFTWLITGISVGLLYCGITFFYAIRADAAFEAQDYEALEGLGAINLLGNFVLIASIALIVRAALVREPKVDERDP